MSNNYVMERQAAAPRGDGLRQKYVGAAGGQFIIILPYPTANELSGIYATEFARGVDTREVKSPVSTTPALWYRLYVLRLSRRYSSQPESSSVGKPANAATVSPQRDRKSSFTLIRRFLARKITAESGRRRSAPDWNVTQAGGRSVPDGPGD